MLCFTYVDILLFQMLFLTSGNWQSRYKQGCTVGLDQLKEVGIQCFVHACTNWVWPQSFEGEEIYYVREEIWKVTEALKCSSCPGIYVMYGGEVCNILESDILA